MKHFYLTIIMLVGFSASSQTLDSIQMYDAFLRDYYLKDSAMVSIRGNYTKGFTFSAPKELSLYTNNAGFITASSSNALTNKSGNISMWSNNVGYLTAEVDGSVINEIQTLSYSSGTIGISSGNTVNLKIPVPYTGNTNASGVFTVTYPVAYGTVPNVQAIFTTTDPRDVILITASSTTGCSFLVQRRADVIGLLPSYSNRASVPVNVLVTPY